MAPHHCGTHTVRRDTPTHKDKLLLSVVLLSALHNRDRKGPHKRYDAPRQSPALSERGNSPAIALAALLPSGPADRGVSSALSPLPLLMAAI